MNTPLTDANFKFKGCTLSGIDLCEADFARKLERDRARLIEAVKLADEHLKLLYPRGVEQEDALCQQVHFALCELEADK